MKYVKQWAVVGLVVGLELTGCGTALKQTQMRGQLKPIEIGFTPNASNLLAKGEVGVWGRISYEAGHPAVTEMALTPLHPHTQEEVLVYVPRLRVLMPAYERNEYNVSTNTFPCTLIKNPSKDTYHPCGTGSRLVKSDALISAARSVVGGALTFGLGAGVDYKTDIDAIQALAEEVGMLSLAEQYLKLKSFVETSNADIAKDDVRLGVNADLKLKINNQTGFKTPPVSLNQLGMTFKREASLSLPLAVVMTDASPFERMTKELQKTRDLRWSEREFSVRCAASVQNISFDSEVKCPQTVKMDGGKISPLVTVTLSAASFGIRYPTLHASDKKLAIQILDGLLTFTNLTDRYLEIKSIAIYAGKDIRENVEDLSIPPQAQNQNPIVVSALTSKQMDETFKFDHTTRGALAGKSSRFGVAVKYRSGDGGNFETLLYSRQVDVLSLIDGS